MHRLGAAASLVALAACTPHAVEPRAVPPESELPAAPPATHAAPRRLQNETFTLRGRPIVHRVPLEQAVQTLVPVYVELPPEAKVTHAVVSYKTTEAPGGYSTVSMKKLGKGFGVELPCGTTRPGTLRLFITVISERSDGFREELGSLGSEREPFLVFIKPTLTGPPPALPEKCWCADCGVPQWIREGRPAPGERN